MDKYIGQRLDGRYLVEQLVGEGGMANVYRGQDLLEKRTVAIKVLKEEFYNNEELVRRFKNEGRAISVLSQQNIVKVYDVSVTDKVQYIIMEHIEGITLKEYIEQRGEPLTYKESILFISQVLRALQHAHDKGVVHRDIKPQNIMITEDGAVKVMDFGIARLARSEIHTDGEQAIGSVHYISPEQAQGASTDPRADIYSTGIMLYEMLCAKLPFESDNAVSIAIKQISDEAVPLCTQNPSVPAGLGDITMKAMAKDPRNRYQTALEMLRDIEEFKRNPSVKFEYDYLTDETSKYVSSIAGQKNQGSPQAKGGSVATKGKRKRRGRKKHSILIPIVAGVTLAVVLTCLYLCYSIFQKSGNPLFVDLEDIQLPNFVGMQLEQVEETLQKQYPNIRLQTIDYEYNADSEPGVVLLQNPASPNGDMTVKENQRLYLTVNSGLQQVPVPDVARLARGEATEIILGLGVRPYVVNEVNESVPVGQVIRTEPAAGDYVTNSQDTVVRIIVSGQARNYERTVPDLHGLTQQAAEAELDRSELSLGQIIEDFSDEEPGTVVRQFPDAGTIRTKGHPVSLVISKGPEHTDGGGGGGGEEEVTAPTFGSLGDAQAWCGENGWGLNTIYVQDGSPAGTILGQSSGGGTVNLTISSGPGEEPDPGNGGENPDPGDGGGGDPGDGGGGEG